MRCLAILVMLLGLVGCATTRLSPVVVPTAGTSRPFSRILVLGPPAMVNREGFEAYFVAALAADSGSAGVSGSQGLQGGEFITPQLLTEFARSAGADGVLTVVPVESMVVRRLWSGPYGYYSLEPGWWGTTMDFQVLRMEISLYPLEGRQPRWQALSETIDPTVDLPGELAGQVVEDLLGRGLILPPDHDSGAGSGIP